MRFLYIIFFLTFFPFLPCFSQKIHDIIIKNSSETYISEEFIHAKIKLHKGGLFSPETLSEDIKSLYMTKKFEDIKAEVEPFTESTVNIFLTITPKPVVEKNTFIGNHRLSTKKLTRKLALKKGDIFSNQQAKEDLESLYDYYRRKGYHGTIIQQQIEEDDQSDNIIISYTIKEKGRHKVRLLSIDGNTVFSNRKLKHIMETGVSFWGYFLPVGYLDEQELSLDYDHLKQAYFNKGYLDFAVINTVKKVNKKRNKVYITLHIEEGFPYTIRSVEILNNTIFTNDDLMALVSSKQNVLYDKAKQQQDVSRITLKYNRNGYIDSFIRAELAIDSENHTVAIRYRIHEGRLYTVRNLDIFGNSITKDHVIRREMTIYPGDLADTAKIDESKRRLLNLGYFESAEILPVSTEEEDKKDLRINVREKLTGQLLFGAGFSSTDNLLGTIEISQSNFDLFGFPSLRGGGQRVRLRAQAGTSRQDAILSFTEPWFLHRPLRLDYDLWNRSTSSNRDYDQDTIGTSVRLTRKLKKPFWRQSFGYRLEEIDINDIDGSFSNAFFEKEEGENLVSAISFGLIRDHRDRIILTSSGSRLSFNLELQSELLGSYTNQYKAILTGDQYIPIFKRSVLKFSGEIGHVYTIDGDAPKVFDRFFTGGANSVRGFRERTIGPVDPNNQENIGGESVLLASAEIMGPIVEKKIFWVFFADSGNVWDREFDWDPSEMNIGVGMGIRLFLPIGIQLAYGWPVVREQEHLSESGRFHFNLGTNF